MAVFFVVPWSPVFQVYCPDIFWMILKWFQLSLLLRVSSLVFTFHMCSVCIVRPSYSEGFSTSCLVICLSVCLSVGWSCIVGEQTCLWCPVYCWGWLWFQFSLDSTVWLLCFHALFRLILVHAHCLLSNFTSISFRMLKCSWAHTPIMPLYVLFSWHYWVPSYNVVYCPVILLTQSEFAISVFNIGVAWYLVRSASSSAAGISLWGFCFQSFLRQP